MQIDILTLFPEMFQGVVKTSILGRAVEKDIVKVNLIDIRDFSTDKHRKVDDYPYGGGSGMVMKPDPIFNAFDELSTSISSDESQKTVFVTPQGRPYNQSKAEKLAELDRLTILCGHYEGVDERVREALVDEELSIGDYVLTGGELPAMVIMDSVMRLLPGVLGTEQSVQEDSFNNYLLEHPQYTRPRNIRGYQVPDILLSGDHQKVHMWRKKESLKRTAVRRPDLLHKQQLDEQMNKLMNEVWEEICSESNNG